MVGARTRVQTDVVPIPEVAILPHRNTRIATIVRFDGIWTSEGLEEELFTLGLGDVDPIGVGGNDIVSLLAIVVA
jgi:hypothetical protein